MIDTTITEPAENEQTAPPLQVTVTTNLEFLEAIFLPYGEALKGSISQVLVFGDSPDGHKDWGGAGGVLTFVPRAKTPTSHLPPTARKPQPRRKSTACLCVASCSMTLVRRHCRWNVLAHALRATSLKRRWETTKRATFSSHQNFTMLGLIL